MGCDTHPKQVPAPTPRGGDAEPQWEPPHAMHGWMWEALNGAFPRGCLFFFFFGKNLVRNWVEMFYTIKIKKSFPPPPQK